jgi:small subunit ribosomal protein S16
VAVRIRLKRMGRRHRPFFRLCAMDKRTPRDGKVLEELGTYDPMIPDVDARALLNGERVNYWLSVGAQPSAKAKVLIKKYGADGTHTQQQKESFERLAQPRELPDPGPPASVAKPPSPPSPPEPQAAEPQATEPEATDPQATEPEATEPPADSQAAKPPADAEAAPEATAAAPEPEAIPPESEEASPKEESNS